VRRDHHLPTHLVLLQQVCNAARPNSQHALLRHSADGVVGRQVAFRKHGACVVVHPERDVVVAPGEPVLAHPHQEFVECGVVRTHRASQSARSSANALLAWRVIGVHAWYPIEETVRPDF